MAKINNNSMAMVATVSLVGVFASAIGFFSPETCTVDQFEGWTSCAAIHEQRIVGSWGFLLLSIIGFTVSIVRMKKSK